MRLERLDCPSPFAVDRVADLNAPVSLAVYYPAFRAVRGYERDRLRSATKTLLLSRFQFPAALAPQPHPGIRQVFAAGRCAVFVEIEIGIAIEIEHPQNCEIDPDFDFDFDFDQARLCWTLED